MPRKHRSSRSPAVVPKNFARERDQVLGFIRRGQELATVLGDAGLGSEIDQLSASALKPFLFVIVGEVKSGKSSLINALLEAPVCGVDTAPCTTRVQEISFGEEERRTEVSEFEERVQLPHGILKHIAIVDTPGTNSIIREHQVITENYSPQSDLVLFVFFAKNPYTGSAWDFLRYIKHDWQRNTLFVLQQADLLEPRELERTVSLVRQQLTEEGIPEPVVFPVSVLTGAGLDVLREYLRIEVVQGRQFNKSISLTHNLLRFLRRLDGALLDHQCLLEHDDVMLSELRDLAVGLGPEAEQEYATLSARARNYGDQAKRWLVEHLQGGEGTPAGAAPAPDGWGDPYSYLQRLRKFSRGIVESTIFGDALSTGWDTSLRTVERLNRLHIDLNRCLFRAQLRRTDLYRQLRRRLEEQLDAIANDPPCLTKPREDILADQRQETLVSARRKVRTLGDLGRDGPAPRLPALTVLSRWSSFYGFAQVGAAVAFLVLGFSLDDLFTGLLLGLVGYLGAGYALAAHSRRRVSELAGSGIQRSLEDVDRHLRESLMTQPVRLQRITQAILTRFEANLEQRRMRCEELMASVGELREQVKQFQSETWADAAEREE